MFRQAWLCLGYVSTMLIYLYIDLPCLQNMNTFRPCFLKSSEILSYMFILVVHLGFPCRAKSRQNRTFSKVHEFRVSIIYLF